MRVYYKTTEMLAYHLIVWKWMIFSCSRIVARLRCYLNYYTIQFYINGPPILSMLLIVLCACTRVHSANCMDDAANYFVVDGRAIQMYLNCYFSFFPSSSTSSPSPIAGCCCVVITALQLRLRKLSLFSISFNECHFFLLLYSQA